MIKQPLHRGVYFSSETAERVINSDLLHKSFKRPMIIQSTAFSKMRIFQIQCRNLYCKKKVK